MTERELRDRISELKQERDGLRENAHLNGEQRYDRGDFSRADDIGALIREAEDDLRLLTDA